MSLHANLVAGAAALVLVGLDSIPATKSIADRLLRRTQYDEQSLAKTAYRDEDGEATEESLRAFSDKWERAAIALFSATGLGTSLTLSVLATLNHDADSDNEVANWLQFSAWVCELRGLFLGPVVECTLIEEIANAEFDRVCWLCKLLHSSLSLAPQLVFDWDSIPSSAA